MFRYEALDRTGNKVRGAMQVADEAALHARLQQMGYQPTAVEIAQRDLRRAPAPVPRSQATHPSVSSHVTGMPAGAAYITDETASVTAGQRAIAWMFHQLFISIRAGMPAFMALTTVQGQVREPGLRRALGEMALGVQNGEPISNQMERFPRLFSRGDVGMVRAGEMGGFLPEALESIAQRHEQDDNTRRRLNVWSWIFHLNTITFFFLVALSFFFKPAILAGFDASVGLRAVGHALLTITLPGLALYALAVMAFHRFRRNPHFTRTWHGLLLKIPVAANINRLRANATFTRALHHLYKAAVIPATAWEAASDAVPNLVLAEQFAAGKRAVEGSGKLSMGLQSTGLVDPNDVGMVATGEAAGETEQALHYVASRYEEDVRVALGSSVVRGALGFTLAAVALGMLGEFFLMKGYYGDIVNLVMKGMGVE